MSFRLDLDNAQIFNWWLLQCCQCVVTVTAAAASNTWTAANQQVGSWQNVFMLFWCTPQTSVNAFSTKFIFWFIMCNNPHGLSMFFFGILGLSTPKNKRGVGVKSQLIGLRFPIFRARALISPQEINQEAERRRVVVLKYCWSWLVISRISFQLLCLIM